MLKVERPDETADHLDSIWLPTKKEEETQEAILNPGARVIMDYVSLPTYKDVLTASRHESEPSPKEDSSAVVTIKAEPTVDDFQMRSDTVSQSRYDVALSAQEVSLQLTNSSAKFKKGLQWTWEVVADRIKAVGLERYPIDLDEKIVNFSFNKHYLHNLYGGSFVDTFPHPEEEKIRVHGVDDLMCLVLDWNPHAPVIPGKPGLYFQEEPAHERDGHTGTIYRLIVRVRNSNPALWCYMGQYRMYPSESLTSEEYASQSAVVHRTWAKDTLKKSFGARVCARVFFRKRHGRAPSEAEFISLLEDTHGLATARSQLTQEDIMGAYRRGEEAIGIYGMKCIGYDVDFQRVLASNYKYFTPPKLQPKKARSANVKKTKPTRKRKQHLSDSDTPESYEWESGVEVIDVDREEEEVEVADHEPRARRSRPQAKRVKSE